MIFIALCSCVFVGFLFVMPRLWTGVVRHDMGCLYHDALWRNVSISLGGGLCVDSISFGRKQLYRYTSLRVDGAGLVWGGSHQKTIYTPVKTWFCLVSGLWFAGDAACISFPACW